MLPKVTYKLLNYNGKSKIAVIFSFDKNMNDRMQNVACAIWTNTLKCWLVPDTNANREKCNLPLSFVQLDYPNKGIISNQASIAKRLLLTYQKIKLKGYSSNTNKNYCLHLREYFSAISKKYEIDTITQPIIERYLLWRLENNESSEHDINNHINAIKFYYEQVLEKERMLFTLPRPKNTFNCLKY